MPDSKLERMRQSIAAKKLELVAKAAKPALPAPKGAKEGKSPAQKGNPPKKPPRGQGKPTPPNPDKIVGPHTAGPKNRDKLMRKKGRLPNGSNYNVTSRGEDKDGSWTGHLTVKVGKPVPDAMFGGTTYEYKIFTHTAVGLFQLISELHQMWVKWQKEQEKPKEEPAKDPPILADLEGKT